MSFDLVRLGDCILYIVDNRGKTPPQTSTGHELIETTSIVGDNKYPDFAKITKFVSDETYNEWFRKGHPVVGDILISTVGVNIGNVSILNENRGCIAQNLVALRLDKSKLLPDFLYYFLILTSTQEVLKSLNIGTAQPSLKVPHLLNLKLNLPPVSFQFQASSILSALDNRISLLRETNTTLEAIAQTLFKSWFVDFDPVKAKAEGRRPEGMDEATAALFPSEFEESALGLIPKGWRVEKLGDIVQRITKGTTPTTLKKSFVSSGINFIKAESMTEDGDFIPDKFAFIDSDTHELLRRSQLQSGDVLITIAGTIGRMAIITEEFLPANTNQAVAIIRPTSEHLPSGLLSLFLQTSALREIMDGKVVQAVQANLSLTSLSDLQLVIPPKQTVSMLYQVGIAHINDVKKHNRSMIRTLTTLRDTLLPRLISGQLRLNQAQEIMDEVGA